VKLRPAKSSSGVDSGATEDAAMVLAVVVAVVFGAALITLILLEFIQNLPGRFGTILVISLVAFGAVVMKAALSRILSTPKMYRSRPPVLRPRRRRKAA
jgi:hypothetical protein